MADDSEIRRIDERLDVLDQRLNRHHDEWQRLHDEVVTLLGKSAGLRAGWLYLLGAVAAMGTLITVSALFWAN